MLPNEIAFAKIKAPPVPAGQRMRARECIEHYVNRANRELGARLPMPTCSFDLRGKTAGQAYYTQNHVRLNAILLVENFDGFLHRTIPHEVAHLVAHAKYGDGISAHGDEWQRVMRAFGLEPSRCHSFDTSNAAVASVLYRHQCACKTFNLSARKHAAGLLGNLSCKACKHTLQYTGEARIEGDWQRLAPAPTTAPVPAPPRVRKSAKASRRQPAAPVAPARPVRPAPAPVDGPSAPMLNYMQSLARSLGWSLPPEALKVRRVASEFIDKAKAAVQARGAATGRTTIKTPTKVGGAPFPPTEKQLAYAQAIAKRKGLVIAEDVLGSKLAISAWIDANK
ncbi:SprT-like domain-containing protein [Burkholderia cenocepacia]|uniref:SprT-like domain-containing protein n=1 Tax=Burkholderia cenocepacia TaxID=95486 RepID=UPI00076BC403|nr:SprT-like domain-containing protein [Burkholderia cenocepacia]KWU23445.1 hypothetical protein AS149_37280 [Burkholderia cenocepacia]